MIIDLNKFIASEQPYWTKLEEMLNRLDSDPALKLPLSQIKQFHYLYQRTSADLAKVATFSTEQKIRLYLESLVGRAYGRIHATRKKGARISPLFWFFNAFPNTFRRHILAFYLSLAMIAVGAIFGGLAIMLDPDAKPVLMPFPHLLTDPSDRVAKEEAMEKDHMAGAKSSFSSFLMTHNTRVSIFVLALGMTWGIGTVILLFSNGVMLGAVVMDYVLAGEAMFLTGWLLPHGSIEIPAILIAGQAGLVLAGALIGWNTPIPFAQRMRNISNDLVTLIFGVAVMLIWAGIVESFFSQYHEPVIPYGIKIAFGALELVLLVLFLSFSGRTRIAAYDR